METGIDLISFYYPFECMKERNQADYPYRLIPTVDLHKQSQGEHLEFPNNIIRIIAQEVGKNLNKLMECDSTGFDCRGWHEFIHL